MAKLDPKIAEVLKTYGFSQDACWNCHGVWVVYHWACEQIAAKAGIEFSMPQVLEANGTDKSVALCVAGTLNDKSEWSIGEASPANNKNGYPYAMAEKRAKDRVILKLLGLHGVAYSEEEADAFKEGNTGSKPVTGPYGITELKKKLRELGGEVQNWETVYDHDVFMGRQDVIEALDQARRDLPEWMEYEHNGKQGGLDVFIQQRLDEVRQYDPTQKG